MSVIKPELFNHWKFQRLKQLVGRVALEYLARLWAHCESNRRGECWPEATQSMVEGVCLWDGEPGLLYKNLIECRWIDELPDGGVRIRGWEEVNHGLVHCWNAWKKHNARRNTTRQEERKQAKLSDHSVSSHRPITDTSSTRHRPVTDGSVPYPPSPIPTPSVQVRSTSFKGGMGEGTAAAAAKSAPPSSGKGGAKRRLAHAPSHVRYAAISAEIKDLEDQETENGRLSAENAQRLKTLRQAKAAIRRKQTEV